MVLCYLKILDLFALIFVHRLYGGTFPEEA
jgi:hypothetical protein